MDVLFHDVRAINKQLEQELSEAITNVLNDGYFIGGRYVEEFEVGFAKLQGGKYFVSTGNATDALLILFKALDIGPGDEVIVPAWGWVSAAAMITLCGAKPIFVDCAPNSCNIDPKQIENSITASTKAIVAIHTYGIPADLEQLVSLSQKHKLSLIEDCAQAHLASFHEKPVGTFGTAGVFSFYPTKNLGALGDGGGILCSDLSLATTCRAYTNHGGKTKDQHDIAGFNSRLDAIQAAILSKKLNYLESWTNERKQLSIRYATLLADMPSIRFFSTDQNVNPSYHLFVIQCQLRDKLKEFLSNHGVQTLIHYPQSTVSLPPYQPFIQASKFPMSISLARSVLSLPLYPGMDPMSVDFVCELCRKFYESMAQ